MHHVMLCWPSTGPSSTSVIPPTVWALWNGFAVVLWYAIVCHVPLHRPSQQTTWLSSAGPNDRARESVCSLSTLRQGKPYWRRLAVLSTWNLSGTNTQHVHVPVHVRMWISCKKCFFGIKEKLHVNSFKETRQSKQLCLKTTPFFSREKMSCLRWDSNPREEEEEVLWLQRRKIMHLYNCW